MWEAITLLLVVRSSMPAGEHLCETERESQRELVAEVCCFE